MREEILKFIQDFISKNGYPPTLGEIGKEYGIAKSNVSYHLNALRAEGKIDWHSNKARTIVVL